MNHLYDQVIFHLFTLFIQFNQKEDNIVFKFILQLYLFRNWRYIN